MSAIRLRREACHMTALLLFDCEIEFNIAWLWSTSGPHAFTLF